MEVNELIRNKQALELAIGQFLAEEFKTFTTHTGINVNSISVYPKYSYVLGSSNPVVFHVDVKVDLDI